MEIDKSNKILKLEICIFAIGFLVLFIMFIADAYVGKTDNQFLVFFRKGEDYMADLFNVIVYSKDRNPYMSVVKENAEKAYFPLTYLICYALARIMHIENYDDLYNGTIQSLGSMPIVVGTYAVIVMIMMVMLQIYDMLQLEKANKLLISGILVLSGVMLFSYERANLILLALAGMILFLNTYDSEIWWLREMGYLGLAVAAALKGYPAILGVLLIYRHEWKEMVRLIIYGIVFSIGPFVFLHGGFSNIPIWLENLKANSEKYIFSDNPKLGYLYFITATREIEIWKMAAYRIWKPIITGLSVAGVILSYFQPKHWIRICMLMCIIIVYPTNSGLYCLLYLLPVIVLYLNEKDKSWWDIMYLIPFLIILSPYQIIGDKEFNYSILASNIAVMFLFGACLITDVVEVVRLIKNKKFKECLVQGIEAKSKN